ncbi:MAG: LysR family transcriptional regulator [Synergistaceae bacterium]|nr:LysR family transcriptional regulator [Synergistaceae bacterium]
MDIRKYEVFLRAADSGNLTKSGEELGYTQSGVSHMMKSLEEELGFRLLYRSNSGVILTPEGMVVMPAIRELVRWNEQLDQLISSVKGIEKGVIRIGALSSVSFAWLPKIIKLFQIDYPNIDIDIIEGGFQEIEDWLEEKRIDIGFLSIKNQADYDTVSLQKDRFMAVLPPDHPFKGRKTFQLSDFNCQTFIISARGADYDIHDILDKYSITPHLKFSSTDDHTIISMVANGLGVSILPELMLEGYKDCVLSMELEPNCSRVLGMAVPSFKETSLAVKKFMSYVSAALPEIKIQ